LKKEETNIINVILKAQNKIILSKQVTHRLSKVNKLNDSNQIPEPLEKNKKYLAKLGNNSFKERQMQKERKKAVRQ